ncbi:MAG TPA: GtrA family protein [Anaeromyxobacteraceae bacterium]
MRRGQEVSAAAPGVAGVPAWPREALGRRLAVLSVHAPAALFAALLVLGLVPIWLVPHVPTQDGANHVESVMGLLRLPHSALLQRYYLPNYGPQPNWLTQILFAGLVQLVSPRVAEKLVLSGYLVLLPLAFRGALPRSRRGQWAALAIFPFLHSYPFHMGFWNFSYSLVLFFATVGFWYRRRGRLTARRGLAFCAITFLLFVAHSVSTAAAFAAITAILAWRAGLALARAGRDLRRRRTVLRGYLRRAVATYAWALPTLALMGLFLLRQPKPYAYRPALFDYLKHFATLYALVSFDKRELLLTFPVVVVVAAAVVATLWARRKRRLRPVDGWLAAGALAAALYFLTPDSVADGAQLTDRLALYPFFAALLWLGWSSAPVRLVRGAALVLVGLFLAATAFRLVKYQQLDSYLAEYESVAPHVAEGSTVLPLTFAPFGPRQGGAIDGKKLLSYRVQVFQHVNGWIATDRHGVDLDNSQAGTTHTPLRWRDELKPSTYLATRPFGLEDEPPCVELWTYPALGGRIDYVLVWGATPAAAKDECGGAVLAELGRDYERVFVSEPRGMAELWRPRHRP